MGGVSRKLEEALTRAFDMETGDAKLTAETVAAAFQGEDEVNDEDLDKEIRSLFYTLEKEQLLSVRRTEYKFEGQVRRAYFWRLNNLEDWGSRLGDQKQKTPEELEAIKVYRTLPSSHWSRRPA